MKLQVDGRCIRELTQHEMNVLSHDIGAENLVADMERRMKWIVDHKYTNVRERIIQQWFPILQERYESLPAKDDKLIQLIFQQPDYRPDSNWHKDNQSDHDREQQ